MEKKTIKITDTHGLHLRVAGEVVTICKKYKSKVVFSTCEACEEVDGCSVLSLLLLEAQSGSELIVKADGPDAKELIDEVNNYFSHGSGI